MSGKKICNSWIYSSTEERERSRSRLAKFCVLSPVLFGSLVYRLVCPRCEGRNVSPCFIRWDYVLVKRCVWSHWRVLNFWRCWCLLVVKKKRKRKKKKKRRSKKWRDCGVFERKLIMWRWSDWFPMCPGRNDAFTAQVLSRCQSVCVSSAGLKKSWNRLCS